MENRLEKLLLEKPEILDQVTKTNNVAEALVILKQHIDHYSKMELNNDITRIKNGKFTINDDQELVLDQLEQVAGGTNLLQRTKIQEDMSDWLRREKLAGGIRSLKGKFPL